jgi:predicted nucleic acid-binding protein
MPNNNQEAMARLVVDTNSLIQCISRSSRYHDLWLSFLDGRNVMCVSTEILSEYAEILERYTSPEFAEAALGVITNNPYTLFVTPYIISILLQPTMMTTSLWTVL